MKKEKIKEEAQRMEILRRIRVSLIPAMVIFCLVIILYGLNSCTKFEEPNFLYNTSQPKTDTIPAITSVSPAIEAVAGVREIQIRGKNFNFGGSDTNICIGGIKPLVKPSIKSKSDSMITIYRPNLTQDEYGKTVILDVTNPTAVALSATAQYIFDSPGNTVGDYGTNSGIFNSSAIGIMDFDKQDNAYVIQSALLCKIDPSGASQTIIYGVPSKNAALADYKAATDFKFAPSGNAPMGLFACKKSYLYNFRLDSSIFTKIAPKGLTANIIKFDYNDDGLIYAADDAGGIWKIDMGVTGADTTATKLVTKFPNLKEIHITGGYFYMTDGVTIQKSQISNGDLGSATVLVDLTKLSGLSNQVINSFAIDENHNLFICLGNSATVTTGLPNYSIYYQENGSSVVEPFYFDTGILPNSVEHIMWGHSNYLYLISNSLKSSSGTFVSGRVFRMALDRNGAPSKERTY